MQKPSQVSIAPITAEEKRAQELEERKKKELARHGIKEIIEVNLNQNQKINFHYDPFLVTKVKYNGREVVVTEEIVVSYLDIKFLGGI